MATLVSIPEAAEIIGVDRTTVWDWVQLGTLKPLTYVGKRAVFDRDEIERFAASYRAARRPKAAAV